MCTNDKGKQRGMAHAGAWMQGVVQLLCNLWSPLHNASEYMEGLWRCSEKHGVQYTRSYSDNDLPVFREGTGVNKDIIHIAYHLAVVDELMEDIIHHCLEHCRGVTQSKKHDSWFKQPLVSLEHSLPLVIFLDLHVIGSPVEIKYSEELSIMEAG